MSLFANSFNLVKKIDPVRGRKPSADITLIDEVNNLAVKKIDPVRGRKQAVIFLQRMKLTSHVKKIDPVRGRKPVILWVRHCNLESWVCVQKNRPRKGTET